MPKVSIIVPMYNVEKYLEKAIQTMKNQTLEDIEIILVDDGSPDNSGAIADSFSEKDSRIKVIHKANGGVSAARNDGLAAAAGEYVLFCDSDDWLDEKACEVLYTAAKTHGADVSIGDVYLAYESGENKAVSFYDKEFATDIYEDIENMIRADIFRSYCVNPPVSGPAFGYGGPWNKLVRRQLLIDKGIKFDLSVKGIFDDILYTAHILANAEKVCYTKYPMYYYRQISGSITHSYKPNVLEINSAIFAAWDRFIKTYDKNSKYKAPFYACVIRRIDEAVKLYFVNDKNPKSRKDLQAEYAQMIGTEPYRTAVAQVETNKLSKKQKLIVLTAKMHLTSLLWKFY